MSLKMKEIDVSTKYNRLKNPNWWEVDQLAIYKHDQEVELGPSEKQPSGQMKSGTWTRDLREVRRCNHSATLPPPTGLKRWMPTETLD